MRRLVLCDIDHTISDAYWRDDMIGGDGGWDAYHAAGERDAPLTDTIAMLNALVAAGYVAVGLTARPEKWRSQTQGWLVRNGVYMTHLLMRPERCFLPSPKVKLQEIAAAFPNFRDEVFLVMDDRDDVCAAFRGEGLTVHQVYARRER